MWHGDGVSLFIKSYTALRNWLTSMRAKFRELSQVGNGFFGHVPGIDISKRTSSVLLAVVGVETAGEEAASLAAVVATTTLVSVLAGLAFACPVISP